MLLTLVASIAAVLERALPRPDVTNPLTIVVVLAGVWALVQVLNCLTMKAVRAVLLFVATAAANAAWSGFGAIYWLLVLASAISIAVAPLMFPLGQE